MRPLRLVVLVLFLFGCGLTVPVSDASNPRTTEGPSEEQPSNIVPSASTTPQPGWLTVPDCPPNASCALGFEIGGRFWSLGCLGVKPASVTSEVIALGDTLVAEVRQINGVSPEVMAAARPVETMGCGDDPPDAGIVWFAAFGPAHNTQNEAMALSLARAICEHGIDPLPGDRCGEGGRVQWIPGDGSELRYSYFPEYQAQVESEVAAGVGPLWRRDLTDVAIRHWVEELNVCSNEFTPYLRCRVGISAIELDGSGAVIDLILQWGTPSGAQTLYETYHQYFTLTSTGQAWWVAAFEEDAAIVHGRDEQGRTESDRVWQDCCEAIIVDVEAGIEPPGVTNTP